MKYLAGSKYLLGFLYGVAASSFSPLYAQIDTFSVNIPVGQIGAYCFDANSLPGDIVSVVNYCPGQSGTFAQVFIQSDTTGCIDYFGMQAGFDAACIEVCDDLMNCDSFILVIEVIDPFIPCQPFWDETTINISVSECEDQASICLPIEIEDVLNFDFSLNGQLYENVFNPCEIDTLVGFSYSEVFGQGNQGPYLLESWTVDGVFHADTLLHIQALIDSMNVWNPAGGWILNSDDNMIEGVGANDYGAMIISALDIPNTTSIISPLISFVYHGSEFYFDLGANELIATDMATLCTDTLQVNVICAPTEPIYQIVYSGNAGVICLDTGDLPGEEFIVRNLCEDESGESVEFDIFAFDPCLNYMTIGEGVDSACILICDEFGFCDTTFVIVNVLKPVDGFVKHTILVDETQEFCLDTDELAGNIIDFYDTCGSHDAVVMTMNESTYCLSFTGVEVGVDSACIVLCDDLGGCDTTIYEIHVAEDLYPLPEAESDYDTLVAGTTTIISILSNDFYTQADVVSVFQSPEHGRIVLNSELSFTYQPDPGFCGEDNFIYEICNPRGECSQAYVSIHVICNDITVYSGFSPNGDGKNDFFVIKGLALYPRSVLQVYNRWGALVLESESYGNDWEGTWKGILLPEGTYFYFLDLKDEKMSTFSGVLYIAR